MLTICEAAEMYADTWCPPAWVRLVSCSRIQQVQYQLHDSQLDHILAGHAAGF